MLQLAPDSALGEIEKPGKDNKIDHEAETEPVALFQLRLRRPHEKRGNVLGVILKRCLGGRY